MYITFLIWLAFSFFIVWAIYYNPLIGRTTSRDLVTGVEQLMHSIGQWLPTGWSRPQSGSRRSFLGSRKAASIVCWSLEFLELRISKFCCISKTEIRADLCAIHIISIIILVWFLLYSSNRPDFRIESCAGPFNLRWYLHSRGGCRNPYCFVCGCGLNLLWVQRGRGMRTSSCG